MDSEGWCGSPERILTLNFKLGQDYGLFILKLKDDAASLSSDVVVFIICAA